MTDLIFTIVRAGNKLAFIFGYTASILTKTEINKGINALHFRTGFDPNSLLEIYKNIGKKEPDLANIHSNILQYNKLEKDSLESSYFDKVVIFTTTTNKLFLNQNKLRNQSIAIARELLPKIETLTKHQANDFVYHDVFYKGPEAKGSSSTTYEFPDTLVFMDKTTVQGLDFAKNVLIQNNWDQADISFSRFSNITNTYDEDTDFPVAQTPGRGLRITYNSNDEGRSELLFRRNKSMCTIQAADVFYNISWTNAKKLLKVLMHSNRIVITNKGSYLVSYCRDNSQSSPDIIKDCYTLRATFQVQIADTLRKYYLARILTTSKPVPIAMVDILPSVNTREQLPDSAMEGDTIYIADEGVMVRYHGGQWQSPSASHGSSLCVCGYIDPSPLHRMCFTHCYGGACFPPHRRIDEPFMPPTRNMVSHRDIQTYTYLQEFPTHEWHIQHGLGVMPSVNVILHENGTFVTYTIRPNIEYVSENEVTLRFPQPVSGVASLSAVLSPHTR